MNLPEPWRNLATVAVGGLTEVGLTDDERWVLVVSSGGRGLFDAHTGLRVARDAATPTLESPWLDEKTRTAQGIGPADGMAVHVVGLWGGALPERTADGWWVIAPEGGRDDTIWLMSSGGERWALDRPLTEVRAVGFAPSGELLVVATASDLALFTRHSR